MALTGMAVYKMLPRTNCKECGFPTCMAFAMQVAAKQKALTDCPKLSEEAKTEMADASAPPMRLVHIGPTDESGIDVGQETVMFRHEEKFHKQPALAVRIAPSLSDSEAAARLAKIGKSRFTRVGQEIGVRLAALDLTGLAAEQAAQRVKSLASGSPVPFVLMTEDAQVMSAAAGEIAAQKPLLYRATPANVETFAALAAELKCALAVSAASLAELADLTKAAREKGAEELILAFSGGNTAQTVRDITTARRAALKKGFRALGYPAMVDVAADDPLKETALAATFVAKYAAIVLIDGLEPEELLAVLTTAQNIYTDPQVPNTVEPTLREIGAVGTNSPVLFTTNFALTYFCVEAEVERSKIPTYISVVETEGLGVLNAFAGDKLSPAEVVKTLAEQKVAEKVSHRKLIIPGLLPSFRAEIEDTSEWKEVLIGPETAAGIPAFLNEHWK